MRRQILLSTLGLSGAALLALPATTRGWATIGGTLDLTQRDVRVFDNFQNPEANDNTASDPSFPGAHGAVLAIWKGVAEWGSGLHGDGEGDPTQPAGIGSGGANFDSTWQGEATSPGGPDDNVASEISGASLGVLAFTETPIADGWRIRFYTSTFVWEDGPADFTPLADHKDIQGVATHEYGHALGLGHSSVGGTTMFPSGGGTNVEKRSIEQDDVDGLLSLYGAAAPAKPRIDGYDVASATITLRGARFTSGSEAWFTDQTSGHDGTPVKVPIASVDASGTHAVVTLPASAGPGDVLLKVPGTDGASLSNAFPFDPAVSSCDPPVVYGTAKTTSQGTLPELFTSGRPRLSVNDFAIGTGGGIAGAQGVLFSGAARGARPFHGGTILCAGSLRREGLFAFDFLGGVSIPMPVTSALVGTTRCYQLWFHDAGDASGVGLSNAVEVRYCP